MIEVKIVSQVAEDEWKELEPMKQRRGPKNDKMKPPVSLQGTLRKDGFEDAVKKKHYPER